MLNVRFWEDLRGLLALCFALNLEKSASLRRHGQQPAFQTSLDSVITLSRSPLDQTNINRRISKHDFINKSILTINTGQQIK